MEKVCLANVLDGTFKCNDTQQGTDEYFNRYTFATFAHLCDDSPLVLTLNDEDFALLKRDVTVGLNVKPENVQKLSIYEAIRQYSDSHQTNGFFVKVADASPKDTRGIESQKHAMTPLRSPEDLWTALTNSKRVRTFVTYHQGRCDMVLRPWNNTITRDNEYRVFVFNQRARAISQQHLYTQVNQLFTADQLTKAVDDWLMFNILPEKDAVLDVYFDNNCAMHLIECNPAWFGSGAALFTWDELKRIAESDDMTVKVRCISD